MDSWLHVPGAAMLRVEREWLRDMAAQYPEGVIVNIGVLWGASLIALRTGAPEARLIGVDIDCKQLKCEVEAELWEGDSADLHARCDAPIDMLFIDGDHSYEAVTADSEGWTPLVAEGGLVVFHDYSPSKFDLKMNPTLAQVRRAVKTWRRKQPPGLWQPVDAPGSLVAFRRERGQAERVDA